MVDLDVLGALLSVWMFASLVYFFYLVLRYGHLLRHSGHEGEQRPLREAGCEARLAMCHGEPEHGAPENVLDEIASAAVRMARAAR